MDLKNLLNDGMNRQQDVDEETKAALEAQQKTEDNNSQANNSPSQTPKAPQIPGPPHFNYNFELQNLLKQQLAGSNSSISSTNLPPNLSTIPFMQQFSQQPHMRNFMPFQQPQMEQPSRQSMRSEWGRGGNVPSNGGAQSKAAAQYDQFQPPTQYKQEKPPRNGHPQQQPPQQQPQQQPQEAAANYDSSSSRQAARQAPPPPPASSGVVSLEVMCALKTIERYKSGEIRNELQVKEGGDLLQDFPESPVILTAEAYESQNGWSTTWKPEQIEKIYAEITVRDQKSSKEMKKTVRDFRKHVESSQPEDEIWYAKDLPLMHLHSCMNSKKNRNCMGCSTFWKCVQGIQEELKPWGNTDLLHYEPEHSETFFGHVAMNGSFNPQQVEVLACDAVHTLFFADDPNGVAIWGFISPNDIQKLAEEDGLSVTMFDQKTLIDPAFFEKKAKVIYGIQKVGQTVVVPSGWAHWIVRAGRGLSFSASWNILRISHIADARRAVELNRSLGTFRPFNISSLIVSAAYQKLDELECVETSYEKSQICQFLLRTLPILKTLVLEEILGEPAHLSASAVLGYDLIVEKFASEGRRTSDLPTILVNELSQVIDLPLAALDTDVTDEDEDVQFSCNSCKYILFNTRRSCHTCKTYDLCEPCYSKHGKRHVHKMKRHRKGSIQTLLDLVESIRLVLLEHEQDEKREAAAKASSVSRKRERKEISTIKDESSEQQENYDEEVIECICGNNKDLGFMISCEKCYAWLHGKCVGISKRNEPEVYYCPRCVKKPVAINAKLSPKDFSPEEKLKEYNLM